MSKHTVKIGEWIDKTCNHPEHSPKVEDIKEPGVYRHVCPQCEEQVEFTNIHTNPQPELMSVILSSWATKRKEGKPWPWK